MRYLRHAALPVVPVALVLLAACGSGGDGGSGGKAGTNGVEKLSAKEILDKSVKATSAVPSAHLKGRSTDGQKLEMDFRLAANAMTGTLTLDGQRADMVRVGSTVYFKAGRGFWESKLGPSAAGLLDGKYFKASGDDPKMKSFADLTYLPKIVQAFAKPTGELKRGEVTKINGTRAITLTDGSGDKLYVAAEGEPYILKLASHKNGDGIQFDGFGEKVQAEAPPSDEVFDADSLSRG